MSRKLRFAVSGLIGVAMAMWPAGAAFAAGHGGGPRGGSFSGGSMSHSMMTPQFSSPHFSQGSGMSFPRQGLGTFGPVEHMATVPQGQWRHTQAWHDWGPGVAWSREHGFDRDRDFDRRFGFTPFWFPNWYGFYGWPYYRYYGYYDDSPGYDTVYYGEPSGVVSDVVPTEPAIAEGSASLGEQYAAQARESFRNGDYREALRLTQHAAIDMPRDPAVHELVSLALFALKDYRGGAIEAHAALSLGPPIDWPTLYAYYGNADTYTAQLRALESFVRDNPKAAEGHFLLGYQYIITGSTDAAKKELAEAVAQTPKDKLAESLLKRWK